MPTDSESKMDDIETPQPLSPKTLDDFLPLRDFSGDAPLAVAVSGGPDSMALCHLLSQWALSSGVQIHAMTLDHGLREEATTEANQVGLWLSDLPNVRHIILTRTVDKDEPQSRIMEDARHDRYAMMAEYCAEHDIHHLFVAHHRDDQAETFLFRLAKGSGLDGLSCMQPAQPYNDDLMILRPLLSVTKEDILSYCKDSSVSYVQDPSNENDHYARPRLRKSAAALAEEGLTAKRLSVTAARLSRARVALEQYTDTAFTNAIVNENAALLSFDYNALSANPEEIRLRVLLRIMAQFNPDKNYAPRMEKCEELCTRIFGTDEFKAATLGGVIFRLDAQRKTLSAEKENMA